MIALVFVAIFSLSSCGARKFSSVSHLDRLKILAIEVDRPEITYDPNVDSYTVQVLPFVSDIGGTGDLMIEWQVCLDPGVSLGASPSCDGFSVASQPLQTGVSPAVGQSAEIFGDKTRTGKPQSGAISLTFPFPRTLWSLYSQAQRSNGVAALVLMKVRRVSDGMTISGFRRVLISDRSQPNLNPILTDIKGDGVSLNGLPPGPVALTFESGTAPENYEFHKSDGSKISRAEVFEVSWFTSDGALEVSRTRDGENNRWDITNVEKPGAGKVVLVAVLRDGRGGVSCLIRNF